MLQEQTSVMSHQVLCLATHKRKMNWLLVILLPGKQHPYQAAPPVYWWRLCGVIEQKSPNLNVEKSPQASQPSLLSLWWASLWKTASPGKKSQGPSFTDGSGTQDGLLTVNIVTKWLIIKYLFKPLHSSKFRMQLITLFRKTFVLDCFNLD